MPKTRPEIQRAYRARKRAALAAVGGGPDAALLPVRSLGVIIEFCEAMGTLKTWDENDPGAIAKAHELALDLALKMLGRNE